MSFVKKGGDILDHQMKLSLEQWRTQGGGGGKGGSNQFVLFRSKWNKETHQYVSI